MRYLISLLILAHAVYAVSGDLISNGSFELGISNNVPIHWGTTSYNQSLVRGYQNSQSLQISNETPSYSIGAQTITLSVKANTLLSLIGQIKGTEIIPEKESWQGAKAQVVFLDKKGNTLGSPQETPAYTGSFDWQLFVQNIIVPPNAVQAKILLGLWGAQGIVQFDDIMLYPMAQRPVKQAKPNILSNGDFELWGNWLFVGEGTKEIKFPGINNEGQALYISNTRHVWTFAEQDIPATQYAGKKLILSGDYKCTKIIAGKEKWQKGRVYLEFINKDNAMIGQWIELLAVDGTTEWKNFSKEFMVPKNATNIKIYCGLQEANGEIAFDNLYLKAR